MTKKELDMRIVRTVAATACAVVMTATLAHATADGPDYLRVTGVSKDSALNIRSAPNMDAKVINQIPAGTNGVVSFGCIGGMSQSDWEAATDAERTASRNARWCLVGYDRVIGWSAGRFLSEGNAPSAMKAGDRLSTLAGSEWLLRDFAGDLAQAEAWVQFDQDGTAFGDSGCNRFTGGYEATVDRLSFGPLAMTRRACPGAESETEIAFMAALGKTQRIAVTDLVMSLFDDKDTLLATLTRRDID